MIKSEEKPPKIVIGITTYNRKSDLVIMAQSLKRASGFDDCALVVFDDSSHDYDEKFLQELFPSAQIFVSARNLGSDANIYRMYHYFLESEADIFFSIDSDLIFNDRFVDVAINTIFDTGGVLSLYNSFKHQAGNALFVKGEPVVVKKTIGSAGVAFTSKTLKMIMENVPCSQRFDWDWCDYLNRQGIRIMVTENSYIQHIGYTGYNANHAYDMDFGLNFVPGSQENYEVLAGLLETIIVDGNRELSKRLNDAYWIKRRGFLGKLVCFLLEIKARINRLGN